MTGVGFVGRGWDEEMAPVGMIEHKGKADCAAFGNKALRTFAQKNFGYTRLESVRQVSAVATAIAKLLGARAQGRLRCLLQSRLFLVCQF